MGTVILTRRAFTFGAGAAALAAGGSRAAAPRRVLAGLDGLLAGEARMLRGKRVALLTNDSAVDRLGRRAVDAIRINGVCDIVALLSPEHGLHGAAQAGAMVEDGRDAATGLPIYSLYGPRREPPAELLKKIDWIVVDLPDVGLRPFTYAGTIIDVLAAAFAAGVRTMVLDRPNPLGGTVVDGPLPDPQLISPVAALPVPLRHGMTIAELARLGAAQRGLPISTLAMQGWERGMGIEVYDGGQLPFNPPSPNLRSPQAMLAYAASVLVEGTNLSEGRGTPRPFEMIGAPWIDGGLLSVALTRLRMPGVRFSPVRFTPDSSKHAGIECGGVRFKVTDQARYQPLLTGLALLAEARRADPDRFAFLPGERPFFDLLTGQAWLREALLADQPPERIAARWRTDAEGFRATRGQFLLY